MLKPLRRLDQLVSVRGLAAWLVVLFHSIALLRVALPTLPPWVFDVIAHGYLAVDFFFVLSGFIIFINYHDKFTTDFWHNASAFYWNRFTRIYPVHFLMMLAYLALACSFFYFSVSKSLPLTYTLQSFVENLALVQAWSGTSTSWNVPSWSISAEWFVYLLFPVFAVLIRKHVRSLIAHFSLVFVVLLMVFAISQIQLNMPGTEGGTADVTALPLVRAFYEFVLGTIVGSLFIHHQHTLTKNRMAWTGMIVATGLGFAYLGIPGNITTPVICFLVVCVMSVDTSPLTQLLSKQPLVYLGEISYSTYMVHYFVYDVYKATWLKRLDQVSPASLLISFAIVLLLSIIMHKFIEMPAQRYLRLGRFKGLSTMVRT